MHKNFSVITKIERLDLVALAREFLVWSSLVLTFVCAGIIIQTGGSGSKPKFLTDGRGQCQRRPGREAGYKVGPSERQTTHS